MQEQMRWENLLTIGDLVDDIPWQPFRPGVEIHYLYKDESGAACALLRYQPGATVPLHKHGGYEHIFVLSGSQTDEHATHRAGSFTINPPDTTHSVASEDGCIVLIIWERPVELCQ
ncbi:MAG: cupin domain-containing protein [Cyanobacteria bacterium P01_E01_bin.45]